MINNILSSEAQQTIHDTVLSGISADSNTTVYSDFPDRLQVSSTKNDRNVSFNYENPNNARQDGWNPPATQLWITQVIDQGNGVIEHSLIDVWSAEGPTPSGIISIEHHDKENKYNTLTRISTNPDRTFRALARLTNIHLQNLIKMPEAIESKV